MVLSFDEYVTILMPHHATTFSPQAAVSLCMYVCMYVCMYEMFIEKKLVKKLIKILCFFF